MRAPRTRRRWSSATGRPIRGRAVATAEQVEIAIARLPHISNYDDFLALEHEPGVVVLFAESPSEITRADLVVIPGSKSTVADLAWLRSSGLADAISWRARRGEPVIGICGGCQMLGKAIEDPDAIESSTRFAAGLNLLPLVAVTLMIFQQKMMTPQPQDEQQEMQQKVMKYMMVFFGLMFYKVAAGLCIYFISSSLWGLAERKLLPRKKVASTAGGDPGPNGVLANRPPPPRGGGRAARKEPKKPDGPPGTIEKLKSWWAHVLKQAQKK